MFYVCILYHLYLVLCILRNIIIRYFYFNMSILEYLFYSVIIAHGNGIEGIKIYHITSTSLCEHASSLNCCHPIYWTDHNSFRRHCYWMYRHMLVRNIHMVWLELDFHVQGVAFKMQTSNNHHYSNITLIHSMDLKISHADNRTVQKWNQKQVHPCVIDCPSLPCDPWVEVTLVARPLLSPVL
jgi:hypothetical protein